jgi:hypothetical protein
LLLFFTRFVSGFGFGGSLLLQLTDPCCCVRVCGLLSTLVCPSKWGRPM